MLNYNIASMLRFLILTTFGLDYRDIGSDSEKAFLVLTTELGLLYQLWILWSSDFRFSDKLDLTYALDMIKLNFVDKGKLAPRIALFLNPMRKTVSIDL